MHVNFKKRIYFSWFFSYNSHYIALHVSANTPSVRQTVYNGDDYLKDGYLSRCAAVIGGP